MVLGRGLVALVAEDKIIEAARKSSEVGFVTCTQLVSSWAQQGRLEMLANILVGGFKWF